LGVATANTTAATSLINFNTDTFDLDSANSLSGIFAPGRMLEISLTGFMTTNATPGNVAITCSIGTDNVVTIATAALPISQANVPFKAVFNSVCFVNAVANTVATRSTFSMAAQGANVSAIAYGPTDVTSVGDPSGNIAVTATLASGSNTNFLVVNQGIVRIF
jgi:hypothetical protein